MKGYFQGMKQAKKEANIYFVAIKKHTKYCCACGKHFDMSKTTHHHLPFCEDCRALIITKEFGSIEKKAKAPTRNL